MRIKIKTTTKERLLIGWLYSTNFSEVVRIKIKTTAKERLLIGCLYRSPNSSTENNTEILETLYWGWKIYCKIILVGDFNMPKINWEHSTLRGDKTIEVVRDCILQQHVTKYTRWRIGQNPTIIDSSSPMVTLSPNWYMIAYSGKALIVYVCCHLWLR